MSKRILLVDDEVNLISAVKYWLENAGYEPTLCFNTDDACNILREQQFDLLFSDVIMPGKINGFELAELAMKEQPTIKLLLASGYTAGLHNQSSIDAEVLNKPYRKRNLLEKIAELIGE